MDDEHLAKIGIKRGIRDHAEHLVTYEYMTDFERVSVMASVRAHAFVTRLKTMVDLAALRVNDIQSRCRRSDVAFQNDGPLARILVKCRDDTQPGEHDNPGRINALGIRCTRNALCCRKYTLMRTWLGLRSNLGACD
jgi:hypothetical protein